MSFGGGKGGNAGYRYFFGILAGIGRGPVDELVEIRVGTKLAAQPHATASSVGRIDAPDLFGGDKKEGGIQGAYHLLMGEDGQVMPAAVASMIAPVVPTGYRRMITFFFDGLVASLNPYPKPWSFRVRRARMGWDGEVLRPDLAVIELDGQAVAPTAPSYGNDLPRTAYAVAPSNYNVQTRIQMSDPNVKITGLYQGSFSQTEVGDGSQYFGYYEDMKPEPQPDGSLLLTFPPKYYGKEVSTEVVIEPKTGGPSSRTRIYDNPINIIPTPVWFTLTPPPGKTIKLVSSVELAMQGGASNGEFVPQNVEYLPSGQARVNLPVPSWGYNYTAVARFEDNQFSLDFQTYYGTVDGMTPIKVPFTPPSDGQFVGIVSVLSDGAIGSNPGEVSGDERLNVPFTFADNEIQLLDPRASGSNLTINYVYRAMVNSTGNVAPDSRIMAMNPSHIVYECLTNREWGRGWDRSIINTLSFEQAAQGLFDEKFGMCLKWSRRDSIDEFVQDVLNTIGAVIYADTRTALMCLKLIRNDYAASTLKIWDTTNGILDITESNVNTSTVVINEVIVKYREAVLNEDRSVNVQNLASLQSNGGAFNTMTKTYRGIPTSSLARRVAQRDLKANAEGLRRFTLTVDRRGSDLTPGGVMRIRDVQRKIPVMVVRIATVKSGTLRDGKITLSVVQDVFSFPEATFTAEQPNSWSPPNFTPCIGDHEVFEAPYFLLAQQLTPSEFSAVDDGSAYVAAVAERAKASNIGYDMAIRLSAPTPDDVPGPGDAMYCGYEPN